MIQRVPVGEVFGTNKRPVPTMFDFLEALGCKFQGDELSVPPEWEELLDYLEPFAADLDQEIERRRKVASVSKPVKGVYQREEITSRAAWELEAHLNAHVIVDQNEGLKSVGGIAPPPRVLAMAREGFLCGFMLAVDLMAEAYGVDLDSVPGEN